VTQELERTRVEVTFVAFDKPRAVLQAVRTRRKVLRVLFHGSAVDPGYRQVNNAAFTDEDRAAVVHAALEAAELRW
jgi:uncharacterized Rossmann fold enzyme